MSSDLQQELYDAVARQLEAREFLRALDLGPESIRVVGPLLKCMCSGFCGLTREQKIPNGHHRFRKEDVPVHGADLSDV
jgi:hypothetical protein